MTSEPCLGEIKEIASRAGVYLAERFRSLQGVTRSQKGNDAYNLVSDADVQSESLIVEEIRARFPGHSILAEESLTETEIAEHLWIVDPLDGTNNFLHGIGHFAVSIAYAREGVVRKGVVLNPISGEMFSASEGEGAFCNDTRIQVSSAERLSEAMISTGFYYDRGAMMKETLLAIEQLFGENIHGIRRFGTASLDLSQVAAGRFDGYFEFFLSPWDYAAGALIVLEAGGVVETCLGDLLPLTKGASVYASNPAIAPALHKIIGPCVERLARA